MATGVASHVPAVTMPTEVNEEVTTVEFNVVPLSVPAGATTAFVLAAVIKPLPFTVITGMELAPPNEPVLEFTVASVATAEPPEPVAVTSPVKAVMEVDIKLIKLIS